MDKKTSRLKSPCAKTKEKMKHTSEKNKTDDQVIQTNLTDKDNFIEGMAIPLRLRKRKTSGFFISEIRSMMYGFGDCRCPLLKSAEIVETIVRNEMCEMLVQTARNARLRKSDCIGHEDILFLLRKNKVKLRRLLKCLEVKDLRAEVEHKRPQEAAENETASNCPSENQMNDERSYEDESTKKKKRVQLCLIFLENIAVANEYSDLMDDDLIDTVVLERRLRCAKNTERMTSDEYLEYSVARQATFANNKRGNGKFKDWLLIINPTGMEPTDFACELFNYFAHETVAQIVDLALLVRQDSEPDAFDRLRPNTINISEASAFKEEVLKVKSPVKSPKENESSSIDSPLSQHTTSPAAQHFADSSLQQCITKSPLHQHSTSLEQPTSTLQQQSQTSIPRHTIASILQDQFPSSTLQKHNKTSPHHQQYTVSPQHNMTSPILQEASSSRAHWLTSPQTECSSASRIMTSTNELITEETTLSEKRRKILEKRRKLLKRKRKGPKYEGEYSPFDPITPREINEVMRRYSQPIGPFYIFSRVYHKKILKHLLCG